jgi:hypothetical protein
MLKAGKIRISPDPDFQPGASDLLTMQGSMSGNYVKIASLRQTFQQK